MGASRSSRGQTLTTLGAAGLVASLWLPWYALQLPRAAGGLPRQLAGLASPIRLGEIHLTAWQAFNTMPAVLLVAGIIAGGSAAVALTERAGNTSQLTILASVVCALLVGYRIAVPPGPDSFVHPAWGIYLALVSALAMAAGGTTARDEAEWPSVAPAGSWSGPQTVPARKP